MGNFLGQELELRERMAIARSERAGLAEHRSEGSKPVVLQLEEPVWMIKRALECEPAASDARASAQHRMSLVLRLS